MIKFKAVWFISCLLARNILHFFPILLILTKQTDTILKMVLDQYISQSLTTTCRKKNGNPTFHFYDH
jgi:hypothetical protein